MKIDITQYTIDELKAARDIVDASLDNPSINKTPDEIIDARDALDEAIWNKEVAMEDARNLEEDQDNN